VTESYDPLPDLNDRFEGAAYEDLLAAAMYGHSLGEAQKLIADFAHKLAEQIRDAVQCDDPDEPTVHGASWAADLIDPEVP
jgi:hypothetical protein